MSEHTRTRTHYTRAVRFEERLTLSYDRHHLLAFGKISGITMEGMLTIYAAMDCQLSLAQMSET